MYLKEHHIPPGLVRLDMLTRRACRIHMGSELWEYTDRDMRGEPALPDGFHPNATADEKRYAYLFVLMMFCVVRQGYEEDRRDHWPKDQCAVQKLSKKDVDEFTHLELSYITPGDVWPEAASRSWCRLDVFGNRWRYGAKRGGFTLVSLEKSSRPQVHAYGHLLARQIVRGIRKGQNESLERRRAQTGQSMSKESKRRLERLRQYTFKF